MVIKIISGANLNMLGKRSAEYGDFTYGELTDSLKAYGDKAGMKLVFFQSNHEGALIDEIHNSESCDGVVINPGAYSHYSYAIADALRCIKVKKVEVHLTDIYSREAFRRVSVTGDACDKVIAGKGKDGYFMAIDFFRDSKKS